MGRVKITWTNSITPDVTKHIVYRDDAEIGQVLIANPSELFDDSPIPGQTHKYEVQALNPGGTTTDEQLTVNITHVFIPIEIPVDPTGTHPILSNFRILNNFESRVYFDTSEAITGSDAIGFDIIDKTILGVSIAGSGLLTGHYFTVSVPFTYWDNTSIKYTGGSNIISESGNKEIFTFTLQWIDHTNLTEPTAANLKYAAYITQGTGDGLSEANAWSYEDAGINATQGDTVMVLAGSNSTPFNILGSGTATEPIKFIGYNNAAKDVLVTRTVGMAFDDTIMPVLTGVRMNIIARSNIIIKNFQIDRNNIGDHCTDLDTSSNIVLDNIYMKDGQNGVFAFRTDVLTRIRVTRVYVCDMTSVGIVLPVDHGLVDDAFACSSQVIGNDYYIVMTGTPTGSASIIRNSYIDRFPTDSHGGHGVSLKASEYVDVAGWKIEDTLVENVTVKNVSDAAIEARHEEVQYCVYRNVNTLWDGQTDRNYIGIQITSAQNNVFENCRIESKYNVSFFGSTEDPDGLDAGNNNTFKNCIFTGGGGTNSLIGIWERGDLQLLDRVSNDNTFANCTFYGAATLLYNAYNGGQAGTGNNLINCIVHSISTKQSTGSDLGFVYTDSDFWNSFAIPVGTGNISIDPQFADFSEFRPANIALKVGTRLLGVEFDFYDNEREIDTTLGSVMLDSEVNFTNIITIDTDSISATWSPTIITNVGNPITWDVNGEQVQVLSGNSLPVFDLSAIGTAVISAKSTSEFIGLTALQLNFLEVTATDVLAATDLLIFSCKLNPGYTTTDVSTLTKATNFTLRSNALSTVDITNNLELTEIYFYSNVLTSMDVLINNKLVNVYVNNNNLSTAILEKIVVDIDSNGLSNGYLYIDNNTGSLTTTVYTEYQSLIAKGWFIDVVSPPAPETSGNKPQLSNFYIPDANKDRVYFTSSKVITASTINGFKLEGKVLSTITINPGGLSGYFEVTVAFNFWDNNLIRYEGVIDVNESDLVDGDSNKLHDFTLQHIDNQISEPVALTDKYVTFNGSGDGSIGSPWSLTQAGTSAIAGETVWIKAGDYTNQNLVINAGGTTAANPIKFIGYTTDITDPQPTLTKSVGMSFDSAVMPLLQNGTGKAITFENKQWCIIKNIQIDGYDDRGISLDGSSYNFIDNCYLNDTGVTGIWSNLEQDKGWQRITNCYIANNNDQGIKLEATSCLIANCLVCSTYIVSMDYYILLSGSYLASLGYGHIIKDCFVQRYVDINETDGLLDESHTGHGIAFKAGENVAEDHHIIEYSLIENCEILNCRNGSIEFRHSGVRYNVARNINIHQQVAYDTDQRDFAGINFENGCSYNIVEDSVIDGCTNGSAFTENDEDYSSTQSGGDYNTIINTIYKNGNYAIGAYSPTVNTNNRWINCTFYNNEYHVTGLFGETTDMLDSTNEFINCIIANTPTEKRYGVTTPVYSYSNFDTSFATPAGTGNISLPSYFVDAPNDDFNLGKQTVAAIYEGALSIGIEYDAVGRERLTLYSMGAYEKQSTDVFPTYFVSNAGSDSNDGLTEDTSWATSTKVMNEALLIPFVPGDVIAYKRGDYWEDDMNQGSHPSGNEGNPITYTAYGIGARPILNVHIVQTGLVWTNTGSNIWTTPGISYGRRATKNGVEMLVAISLAELGTNGTLYFQDLSVTTFYVYSVTDPTSDVFAWNEDTYGENMRLSGASYIDVNELDLRGGNAASITIRGTSTNWNIINCNIGWMAGNGIKIVGVLNNAIIIDNCILDSNFTVDYTTIAAGGTGIDARGCNEGITPAPGCYDIEIMNCISKNWGHAHFSANGTDESLKITGVSIHDNEFSSPDILWGRAFGVSGYFEDNEIYNNYMHHLGVQNQLGGSRNHVHHNIIDTVVDSPLKSDPIGVGIKLANSGDIQIVGNIIEHNTIMNTESEGIMIYSLNSGPGEVRGNIVRNNILLNCGSQTNNVAIQVHEDEAGQAIYENIIQNNLIHNDATTLTCRYQFNGTIYSASDFNNQSVDIISNLAGDPLLDTDYTLQAGSPAINNGVVASTVSLDYFGNTLPYGNSLPGIGIHEPLTEGTTVNLGTLGCTSNEADALANRDIIIAAMADNSIDTIIVPAFTIPFNIANVTVSNKVIKGLDGVLSVLNPLSGGTLIRIGQNIRLDNFKWETGNWATFTSAVWIMSTCSDIIMKNMTFSTKDRPFKLQSLVATGKFHNYTLEDSSFVRSPLTTGGANPVFSMNVDGQGHNMQVMIRRNFFEGGTQYWGEDGDNPDHSSIDFSGSGMKILNNTVWTSQYAGAINAEDCNGWEIEIAYNDIYLDNVATQGTLIAAPTGVGLSRSTNCFIHHNNVYGSAAARVIQYSTGVKSTQELGLSPIAPDIRIEDNYMEEVESGILISTNYSNDNTPKSYNTYVERNIIKNMDYGVTIALPQTEINHDLHILNNTFYLDDLTDTVINVGSKAGPTGNPNVFLADNIFDFIGRTLVHTRGLFSAGFDVEREMNLTTWGDHTVLNDTVEYTTVKEYNYESSQVNPLVADGYRFTGINNSDTYVSESIDLSQGSEYIKSFALLERKAVWSVEFNYTEASSADSGIAIEVYFSTLANIGSQSSQMSYLTQINHGVSVESRNWKELGNPTYQSSTNNYLSIRCSRLKVGTGNITVTVKTFNIK